MTRWIIFVGMLFAVLFIQAADAVAAKDAPDAKADVYFIELNPLILPVVSDRGVTQVISLVVSVEVDSEEKAEQVRKYSPRLTDAYLSDLYGAFSSRAARSNGQVSIAYIKERLNKISAKVMGEGVIDDVLLQVMQKRQT